MFQKRLTPAERRVQNEERARQARAGTGLYVFQNATRSQLKLPKPSADGVVMVDPGKQFRGDSYFKQFVGAPHGMLHMVGIVDEPRNKEIAVVSESVNKLLLDQPDVVTTQGTVEQVEKQSKKRKQLKEKTQNDDEILLTEDPIDGVEIILG